MRPYSKLFTLSLGLASRRGAIFYPAILASPGTSSQNDHIPT